MRTGRRDAGGGPAGRRVGRAGGANRARFARAINRTCGSRPGKFHIGKNWLSFVNRTTWPVRHVYMTKK